MKLIERLDDNNISVFSIESESEITHDIIDWCKNSLECKGLIQLWTRFGNWDKVNAFCYVMMIDSKVIGVNAFTCNKVNPYTNCYYFELSEEYRGKGLGLKLFNFCIIEGKKSGNNRLTLRTKNKNDKGKRFYNSINMIPSFFDTKTKEIIFDVNISNVDSVYDFRDNKINDNSPAGRRIKMYMNYEKCNV